MDEFLTYRNFLELTRFAAALAALAALVASVLGFLKPFGARSSVAIAATPDGSKVQVSTQGSAPASPGGVNVISRLLPFFAAVCFVLNLTAQVLRYFEVNHWPAQTMYEVIPLGTTTAFLASLILFYVLGLQNLRGAARGFADLFMALILIGAAFTLHVVLQLDPTGRALPPALQSYWFSTHITAYMLGYFTLFIATMAAWLFLSFRFWRSVLLPKEHPMTPALKWGVPIFLLAAAPFGAGGIFLGLGVHAMTGLVSKLSVSGTHKMAWLDTWERGGDRFTWLIFVVGFPFLTAGLIQGGLWAQEAWALYWGWDSKEVSAFISWIFYIVYLHLRYVAGWRGEKGMWILAFGGLSIYITFQLFGYLPASQSSLHRYTDMSTVPSEGMLYPDPGPTP